MRRLVLTALLGAVIAAALASSAAANPPRSFYGVIPQVGLEQADFQKMKAGHVGTVRFLVPWGSIDEGPGPGNEDWDYLDYEFLNLGQRGLKPLPFVVGTPNWVARGLDGRDCDDCTNYFPRSPAAIDAWREFWGLLVGRYGHNGTFWNAHPEAKKPPDAWQVMNEQNSPVYFAPRPDVKAYSKLLKAAAQAIRNQDSRAKVVLGGMFGTPFGNTGTGITAWSYLTRLYRINGIRKAFDGYALHPYAGAVDTVRRQVQLSVDRVRRAHDGKAKLWITEIGWASDGPKGNRLVVGKKGQAKRLRGTYKLFERKRSNWHVKNVSWYAWRDHSSSSICAWCAYSGLLAPGGEGKPAFSAFKRVAR